MKRLVELMDDGAERRAGARSSIVLSSFTSSRSLSRDFFFVDDVVMMNDVIVFFLCVFVRVFLRGVRGDARGSFSSSLVRAKERCERERERERGWKTRDSSSRTTVLFYVHCPF